MPGSLKLFLHGCLNACVFACVSVPKAMNNKWRDINPCDWLNKFYGFYMAVVVHIISGHGLSIHMHC